MMTLMTLIKEEKIIIREISIETMSRNEIS